MSGSSGARCRLQGHDRCGLGHRAAPGSAAGGCASSPSTVRRKRGREMGRPRPRSYADGLGKAPAPYLFTVNRRGPPVRNHTAALVAARRLRAAPLPGAGRGPAHPDLRRTRRGILGRLGGPERHGRSRRRCRRPPAARAAARPEPPARALQQPHLAHLPGSGRRLLGGRHPPHVALEPQSQHPRRLLLQAGGLLRRGSRDLHQHVEGLGVRRVVHPRPGGPGAPAALRHPGPARLGHLPRRHPPGAGDPPRRRAVGQPGRGRDQHRGPPLPPVGAPQLPAFAVPAGAGVAEHPCPHRADLPAALPALPALAQLQRRHPRARLGGRRQLDLRRVRGLRQRFRRGREVPQPRHRSRGAGDRGPGDPPRQQVAPPRGAA